MVELYAQIERAAASRVSVLLQGETGVGKELVAHRLHACSPRKNGPFVAINCAALSENLLEAELFGAERGSFTGATQARPGLFEAAHGGTLFLDEIGELALNTQAKLLRALEDGKVMRVGARVPRDVDVRFVAATNRDLKRASEEGAFRADLFFRVAAFVQQIPPLRERPTEIEPLARFFLDRGCREIDRASLDLTDDALEALMHYQWPGNVRELKNAMHHAAVLCLGARVSREILPREIADAVVDERPAVEPAQRAESDSARATVPPPAKVLKDELRRLERERILNTLKDCCWNQTRAAEILGISRRTLINRLDEYEVDRPRKR
jgi:DNA-binding NtrC family response regulator